VVNEQQKNGIDVSNLVDEATYRQTPVFFAAAIKDEAVSLKMVQVLEGMGAKPS
jgi:hypothetical protein